MPQILESVDVKGVIISADAHYLYKKELQMIITAGADFLVGLKGNQGKLVGEVQCYFDRKC